MRSVETEAATIDEAIARALELLHVDREKVAIEIIDDASRGLLGFGGKKARIKATIRTPLFAGEAVSRETASNTSTQTTGAHPNAVLVAQRAFEEILHQLGVNLPVQISGPQDGSWSFKIAGEGSGLVIGRHGQTLDAIDYLLNRVASHTSNGPVRIVVDVEGYRERRQESLEQVAIRAAEKAKQSGRPVALDPMSPRDRRIVHIALGEDRDVSTRSQGDGSFRRIVIVPNRAQGSRP